MMTAELELRKSIAKKSEKKIVLFVLDGVGGLAGPKGLTELQAARHPNLDALASEGASGVHDPVAPGITPGSGPGHLGLFGYEPNVHLIGRGALEAAGIGFPLKQGDLAIRLNFCTLDASGNVADRRAGRIPTETNRKLVAKLKKIRIGGFDIFVETVKDYRAVLVMRPKSGSVGTSLADSDPQVTGAPPLEVKPLSQDSVEAARLVNSFIELAREALKKESPANGLLTRGASGFPHLASFQDLYKLTPAAVATYPMYRGVASFAGMEPLGIDRIETFDDEIAVLGENWDKFDYFFVHYKYTDSRGEDGDFDGKVAEIEKADAGLGKILALKPDVICATGDHSTPSVLKSHSWHPVPFSIAGRLVRRDSVSKFSEISCAAGAMGRMRAKDLMPEMLAAAEKLEKFGA